VTTTNGDATNVCANTTPANDRVSGSPPAAASRPTNVFGPTTVSNTIPLTTGGSTSGNTTNAVTSVWSHPSRRANQ
jgi:hypothetical protein